MLDMIFRNSLVSRFFRIIALTLMIGTILLSVVIYYNEFQGAKRSLRENGRSLAVFIAKLGMDALVEKDSVALDSIVNDAQNEEIVYILVSDVHDKIMTSRFASLNYRVPLFKSVLAGMPADTELPEAVQRLKKELHITEVTLPVEIDTARLGTVVLGMSEHVARNRLNSTVIFVLSINMLIATLLCITLIMVSRKILFDPLAALVESNLRLAGGDLSARVDIRAKGELQQLVDSFNHMAASLDENEQQLQAIFDTSQAGIIMVNDQNTIIMANQSMSDMFGYAHDELIARSYLSLICPDNFESGRTNMQRLISGEIEQVSSERHFMRRDGSDFPGYISARRHNDAQGRLISIVCIVTDIADQKRIETERLELERQLLHSQKLESLGVLAGGIAHDFNNLLTVILGNLDLTRLQLPPASPSQVGIERAMQASRKAADLTRQMLAYSGKGIVQLRKANLSRIVSENVDLFRSTVPKIITFTINLDEELPSATVDSGQIQQVVMNLITNAAEAIGEKPGVISISTGVQECGADFLALSRLEEKPAAGRYVYVEVSDTGSGMDAETRQRLFEPFYSTKFTGRGLGMSAVLGIVRAHQGAIMLASEPGHGSVFKVLLPVGGSRGTENDEHHHPPLEPETARSYVGAALVVDDEPEVRDFCTQCITLFGFTALDASDGREALEIFRKHGEEIRLVVLDMTMPVMDGLTTFRELRRIRPDVRVIICTGHSTESTSTSFTNEKPDAFIQKPYHAVELQRIVDQVMSGTAGKKQFTTETGRLGENKKSETDG